ncbi:E3 ubiquitin-protein ligase TOM1 [Aspergillus saccharolyticus JOP 1030-1]|uniref:HECT-type E3 ubiquitin transferase n=1 Tax=Aspergillus saccharolyticus JOP 1030-1 TaxID=1450539 RepID=A0A318ZMX0_9EURO|nr:putative ubiquitin-protein ligase [Aspergillus saccharolyticus JOP 1030-1]PYH45250.1 putative ubiquitin-protein ligase [Aspergillus saccharolyticus JOP 1030-1]
MGRIKKVASQKHEATISPYLAEFINRATTISVPELPSHLNSFSRLWPFPRGDLYHWINVLNRFDEILASVIETYALNQGPQTRSFSRDFLAKCYTTDDNSEAPEDVNARLEALQYGPEGDRELLEVIIDFSRLLLEKCGNRSLYGSSERLGDLLNTTSPSLLQSSLRLSLCLAQRYHSRHRGGSHLQQSLLAAHYNIDLEKLQKIAAPFPRPLGSNNRTGVSPVAGLKVKEPLTKHNANDLITLTRENDSWDEWGHVRLLYYPPGTSDSAKALFDAGNNGPSVQPPTTPTPLRRSHTHPTPRLSRLSTTEDSPSSVIATPLAKSDEGLRGGTTLEIPYSKISSIKAEDLVAAHIGEVPDDSKYELLHRIRTAQGLAASRESREQVLAIRILALTNLAYVYPEPLFQQKILQYDMEQPKRLQLAFQLAELVHLGASGDLQVSRTVQTLALQALDALAKHKARAIDVCAALSVNVNHGVLMFLTRKVVNELGSEDGEQDDGNQDEWRDALLALLRTLPGSSTRTPETLVSAGLIPMFVDVLKLRTEKARRVYSRVMEFLDTFVHAVRDALGTLTSSKGFDAISDLIDHETKSSFEHVKRGAGLPSQHKTPSIDYQIPYFQQQTLRWMFRFVNHIMQHNGGGFDRVLRNLIDSPQLLTSLRLVLENARVFGSHVWSNAVNILSSFIHNEPTSYAVIAEAGLSKSLLEAVTFSELKVSEKPAAEAEDVPTDMGPSTTPSMGNSESTANKDKAPRVYRVARSKNARLAPGIMSAAEALSCVPSAFGAICLNSSGLDLFQSSHALESFFEIFENPEHVRCLKDDPNLVRSLGTTFDELVRHHPALKAHVMTAVIVMVARVGLLCKSKAWSHGLGAKLWTEDKSGKPILAGSTSHLFNAIGVESQDSSGSQTSLGVPFLNSDSLPNGGKLQIGDLSEILPSPENEIEPKDVDDTGLTATDYLYPVVRFLGAFFENQANCTYFIESGAAEFILDFATLQSLPFDFHNTEANQELAVLVHMLAETKPHVIVPSLLQRTERAVDMLSEFWQKPDDLQNGFFGPLIKQSSQSESEEKVKEMLPSAMTSGTYLAKHMGAVLVLTDFLREIFSMPLYQSRPSLQLPIFVQVNLADHYCSLVKKLGGLHAACVWEEISLEKNIPDTWDQATKVQQSGATPEKPVDTQVQPILEAGVPDHSGEAQRESSAASNAAQASATQEKSNLPKVPENEMAFKNARALRYLLSSLPSSITGFFHNLGLGLSGKKRYEPYQKQNATLVAEEIAQAVLGQLQFQPPRSSQSSKLRFAYLIVILSAFSHLLFEVTPDRPHAHYLTMVLFAFKRLHGLKVMKDICDLFVQEVKALTPPENVPESEPDVSARITSAYGGIKIILGFFSELASGKNIMESSQTQSMTTSGDRDRDRPDYFQPAQFLVDLRMEILPMAREMWNSDFATQSSSSVVKCLIDILRSSLDGDHESGAARQSDTPPALVDVTRRAFVINKDRFNVHLEKGFDSDLLKEAMYRCYNNGTAEEYCRAQTWLRAPARAPPPPDDIESIRSFTSLGGDPAEDAAGDPFSSAPLENTLSLLLSRATGRPTGDGSRPEQTRGRNDESEGTDILARALTHILNDEHGAGDDARGQSSSTIPRNTSASQGILSGPLNQAANQSSEPHSEQPTKRREVITIEELDKEREKVRSNLIERCLDVLNEHHDVSFELADLIASATRKHRDPESFRKEVGEILVQSLVSLQMENFQAAGKKVAAYAHFLALVVQDREMYTAALAELKECFSTFLGFIQVTPEKTTDESFPWIGHVLLVLEKLLSDDAQPPQIRWAPPGNDANADDEEPAQLEEPLVAPEQKMQLFEALVEVLPRVGKDDTLALSICRILAILTRNREIATRLGEKRSLQRLFVMVKQLSSATNDKLQAAFMLILRHIVEDEDTIRQIMRSEIVANFESKSTRQIDTTGYVRQMYHLVLRSPEIFVEVTNDKLKLQRFDNRQRPQVLVLKSDKNKTSQSSSTAKQGNDKSSNGEARSLDLSTVEGKEKPKGIAELKPPVVENPDGVIHYLLSELLSYKDVDDKEPPVEPADPAALDQSETQTDVDMSVDEPLPSVTSNDAQGPRSSKKSDKPAFKADDHPIYIYRCFLLQCLTELLSSYNRTKVEFINFSRKADPLATTPSKPRSGILNYLLNVLVPVGTMEHDESVAFKKRSNTSAWTMRVLVALCAKTGEIGGPPRRRNEPNYNEDDEPELVFVRRFVLEHALRCYKEANSSSEPLDAKYARLMSLADLFDKMLSGYTYGSNDSSFPASASQLGKTMFEKHFLSALTASVAEIDLNFPASKRVIKYILRPINKLTQTALILSENSDLSTLGETEDDEISSATSVSDMEDDREETPDLFRHSTLGMLEPRHEEETSSEESEEEDDEMYDDEYDEEMDYDEELPEDDGEVVSDEDEIEGMGPIEGLPGDNGMDIEVVLDEDDDEDDEDDDEDDEDDDVSEMDDDDILAGEITGDHDNDSLDEGDEDEWESEDMSEDDEEAEIMNQFEDELDDIRQADQRGDGQRFDDLFRVLNEAAGGVEGLQADALDDMHDDLVDDDLAEDEEDEEIDELEEELEDADDDQGSYQGFDDEEDLIDPWGWDGDDQAPRGHHHHRFRGTQPAWAAVTGIMPSRHNIVPIPPYRLHRTQIAPRGGADDGTNPLLVRTDRGSEAVGQPRGPGNEAFTDWVHGMEPVSTGRLLPMDSPVSFMNAIMQAIGNQGAPGFGVVTRPDGIHVHVDRRAILPNRIQDIFGLGRQQATPSRSRDDPSQAVSFALATTKTRWQEEARILFSNNYVEKTQRVINSLLKILVPPAIEEGKRLEKQAEEERKRKEEERAEHERQERLAREEEEKERKQKEEEENVRRQQELERQEAERRAAGVDTEPMDDVQQTDTVVQTTDSVQGDTRSAEPARRVHTTIRGRQVDITGMEIDPEYLEALPEELREEVIMQQLAEQRSQAAAAGEEPTEINQEFLEALPPEIRDELLQQEAADRRRRERDNTRRRATTEGAQVHAGEMDVPDFFATLNPSLRQAILADQPDEVLATLGPEYVAEARALPGRRLEQFEDIARVEHRNRNEPADDQEPKKPQRRQIVQMLDKPGVATLLRLMFMPLQGNARHQLNDILHNVCENRQNRVEVISLLLSVLQDGSGDVSAIERSFAQLSLRAKPASVQKTPQSVKRNLSLQTSSNVSNEVTPTMVVQQCLGTLSFLSQYNPHISYFFLTEHDSSSSLKLKAFRKGKGKENKANKFALNALLSLLDRKLIMENPNCMEQLSSLLSSITQPLTYLLRREKERQEEESRGKKSEQPQIEQSTSEQQHSATTEHPGSTADATMIDAPVPTIETTQASVQAEEDAGSATDDKAKSLAEEEKHKKKIYEPPVVPDHNLQLVVHILAARECNGKTFRDTLSTINNLSAVPGARDIIGNELVRQAQTLSTVILTDLDELLSHIHQARDGTDMQGLALAKFSPASSDQAKLLRVLTALDYLFDPNRADKVKGSEPENNAAKEDVMQTLYECATFGPLWTRLSECLTVIRQKENMLNVATILLPLIEALMVVCKNTTLKDTSVSRTSRELSVASTSVDNGVNMESLFFKFTEEHRKILNELVRQNPRLMSGTFSLLVKNPKVLEFDNKRNYFTRRLHSRGAEPRHPHPPLQLSVRRDQVFLDSFKSLYFKTADELKFGKLNVRFHGEEGVDAGGVTREWFQVLARGMFNPNYALFIPVASDRTTFHPNRLSGVNSEHLMFFKFIGRIIGKALYEGRVLDCHFSRAVYKCILSRSVSIKDMETLDLDYYKSLLWMLENDITDIITETFAVETDDFGEKQVIDLIENGRNIPVTEENKEEYVQRVVDYRLIGSVKEQLDNFLKGFHEIIPADLISIFNEQELELLISGLPEIDVDDWKVHTEYHNYSASSPQIQWFWRAVRSFDKEERAKLLQFVTGTSKVPLNGFKELEGMNGVSRFNIHRDYGNKDRLPSSHTCFNQLDLPEYESYETLRQRLYTAMTAGSEYFGFA